MIGPLSQVLDSVRLTGSVFLKARFTAPWCTTAYFTPDDIRAFVDTPGQIIACYFVIDGRLECSLAGAPALEVGAGEVVLLPGNDPTRYPAHRASMLVP